MQEIAHIRILKKRRCRKNRFLHRASKQQPRSAGFDGNAPGGKQRVVAEGILV